MKTAEPKDPTRRLGMKLLVSSIARRNVRRFKRQQKVQADRQRLNELLERIAEAFAKCKVDEPFSFELTSDEAKLMLEYQARSILKKGRLDFTMSASFGQKQKWAVFEDEDSDSDDDDEEEIEDEEKEDDTDEEIRQAKPAETPETAAVDGEPVNVDSDDEETAAPSPPAPAETEGSPLAY